MPDVFHNLPIRTNIERVFDALTLAHGLNAWWTKLASGSPRVGESYELFFGEGYDWRAEVTQCDPPILFELKMTSAMEDWLDTRVRFELAELPNGATQLQFAHLNWASFSDHFKTSSYCWAMYLRLLKRHLELGEFIAYEKRLES